jgi:predicted anti-sigma-YlaC factor YlaD
VTGDIAHLSCQEFVELVTDYLEGVLDAATTARFEHHLNLCHGCVVYLEQMQETAARLGSVPVESLSPEAQSALLEAFRGFRR